MTWRFTDGQGLTVLTTYVQCSPTKPITESGSSDNSGENGTGGAVRVKLVTVRPPAIGHVRSVKTDINSIIWPSITKKPIGAPSDKRELKNQAGQRFTSNIQRAVGPGGPLGG